MRPFVSLQARACPLPLANVDTDQLIPARFLRRPRSEGYGPFLLYDLRRRADGELDPDFPLNSEAYKGAEILVARRNFGGGSSREAAVYALADHGFRAVIAPSFGDIFASSAIKNGLLPARVEDADAEALIVGVAFTGDCIARHRPAEADNRRRRRNLRLFDRFGVEDAVAQWLGRHRSNAERSAGHRRLPREGRAGETVVDAASRPRGASAAW